MLYGGSLAQGYVDALNQMQARQNQQSQNLETQQRIKNQQAELAQFLSNSQQSQQGQSDFMESLYKLADKSNGIIPPYPGQPSQPMMQPQSLPQAMPPPNQMMQPQGMPQPMGMPQQMQPGIPMPPQQSPVLPMEAATRAAGLPMQGQPMGQQQGAPMPPYRNPMASPAPPPQPQAGISAPPSQQIQQQMQGQNLDIMGLVREMKERGVPFNQGYHELMASIPIFNIQAKEELMNVKAQHEAAIAGKNAYEATLKSEALQLKRDAEADKEKFERDKQAALEAHRKEQNRIREEQIKYAAAKGGTGKGTEFERIIKEGLSDGSMTTDRAKELRSEYAGKKAGEVHAKEYDTPLMQIDAVRSQLSADNNEADIQAKKIFSQLMSKGNAFSLVYKDVKGAGSLWNQINRSFQRLDAGKTLTASDRANMRESMDKLEQMLRTHKSGGQPAIPAGWTVKEH